MSSNEIWENLPLGKASTYLTEYTPSLLKAIPRSLSRGMSRNIPTTHLPFDGIDIWNAYELSWLNSKGKPEVALGEFFIPCTSPNLIESKSMKLYLNSFNQTRFSSRNEAERTIQEDLSAAVEKPVIVKLAGLDSPQATEIYTSMEGICLDSLDVNIKRYDHDPLLLKMLDEDQIVTESLYTHLFKSNCRITGQPDWASLYLHYQGHPLDHSALLQYLISFRDKTEFHEKCVEQIFMDLTQYCKIDKLTVYARYTRRGGIDINPFRSNFEKLNHNKRLSRQ